MKDYCFPITKSTNIHTKKKIKQLFSTFLLLILAIVSGIFPGATFSSFMENLRPRFEAFDDKDDEEKIYEVECCEKASTASVLNHFEVTGSFHKNPDKRSEEDLNEIHKNSISKVSLMVVADQKPMELRSISFKHENSYQQPVISHSVSDLGLARKEKEWRRTLACKLFQERHNVVVGSAGGGGGGGGEGMDMLWEVYERTEEENRGNQIETNSIVEKSIENSNKSRIVDYLEELEEDEGEDVNLCCLKALKFSTGKMHFGMSKPGFFNFSKAIKGIKGGLLNNHHRKKKKL